MGSGMAKRCFWISVLVLLLAACGDKRGDVDVPADIDGVRDEAPDPDGFLATLIVLDTAAEAEMVSGTVSQLEHGSAVVVTDQGDRCVSLAASISICIARSIH